jgi:hypothetical protein
MTNVFNVYIFLLHIKWETIVAQMSTIHPPLFGSKYTPLPQPGLRRVYIDTFRKRRTTIWTDTYIHTYIAVFVELLTPKKEKNMVHIKDTLCIA